MNGKLALSLLAISATLAIADVAVAQTAPNRPTATRTPPTVEEITARLRSHGLTDAQIAERIATVQAAIAAGERPTRPAGAGGQRPGRPGTDGQRPVRPGTGG